MAPVSTEPVHAVDLSVAAKPTKTTTAPKALVRTTHPLDPLSPQEISAVSLSIRSFCASQIDIKAIKFVTANIIGPAKPQVLAYLGIPLLTGEKPQPLQGELIRRADVDFIDLLTGDAYNSLVTLKGEQWVVDGVKKLPEGTQPQITVHELAAAEAAVRRDPLVQKYCASIGLTVEQIHADGWSIGWDDRFGKNRRLQQALMFARLEPDDNLYAHPLDFVPVLDSNSLEVIHVDFSAHRVPSTLINNATKDANALLGLSALSTQPPPLDEDQLKASGRDRFPFPAEKHEYLPDLMQKQPGYTPSTRPALKPLHVVQPEGVSFSMDDNEIEWQNWKMHVAFTHKEGIALSTVTYNDGGEIRPLFYRLSLAEMVVPYAAPEHPHPRKFAFDVGEYGMGTQANELSLGCDCLGKIHYLPGSFIGQDGHAVVIKRAICIHEEDAGLLWKHTDYRPGGRSHSVRSRRLVISMICTVANYEYLFYYYFYQDGTVQLEIRLSGILNVYTLAPDEPAGPFATQVAPRIGAQYHQHLFSVRIDPMIDGLHNSVVEADIIPLPNAPTGSPQNWAGNAFVSRETVISKASEGARDYDFSVDRRWKIINPKKTHYSSGKPSSFALNFKGAVATLMTQPDSWVTKRAAFAAKSLWVVKDVESDTGGRLWPAGRYVPQTKESPKDSVLFWTQGDEQLDNEDIVLFATLGINHIPRPEDWPVMPVEHVQLSLRPVNFFRANPALDVPSTQDSKSVPAFENGTSNGNGACCE